MFRKVEQFWKSRPTVEGAGVKLKRAFGYHQVPQLDPFLLLDDFHSGNPDDYIAGFPWHPHRGIETITYMIRGEVEHKDSLGNGGVITSGDVQWMTAGSGIIHQEMPRRQEGELWGFQLWANLPASHKMMEPRYRDIKSSQIAQIQQKNVLIRIIAGEIEGVKGPVQDIVTKPEYLDVSIAPNGKFEHSIPQDHKAFAYVIEGKGYFEDGKTESIDQDYLILFGTGDKISVRTTSSPVRFLLISGKPIGEPIAWSGPIVMNTQEELHIAFEEYRNGTFLRHEKKIS